MFSQDLRYAIRSLYKNPGFTLAAVLSLALGIGANVTIFTVIDSIFLNPLPVKKASELAAVYTSDTQSSGRAGNLLPVSYLNLRDLQEKNQVFSSLTGFTSPLPLQVSKGAGTLPQRAFGEIVTGNYFNVLGLEPLLGRFFLPEEDQIPGARPVVVLSAGMWKIRFGGSPGIAGQSMRINNQPFTIAGIAPEGFKGVNAVFGPDLWIPSMMAPQIMPAQLRNCLDDRAAMVFRAAGRLKPGIELPRAEANLKTLASALEKAYPEPDKGHSLTLRPIREAAFDPRMRTPALFGSMVLMAVVGLVLLIACSNVANLLLARAAARRHEVAIRAAIGAGRGRLIRQMLTESMVLALLSGACAIAVGQAGLTVLLSFRPPEVAQNLANPQLDLRVFLFALMLSLLTGLIFGIMPALEVSKAEIGATLREDTRTAGSGRRRVSIANLLLAGQVAFSLVALITAGLFLRGVERSYAIDPGFETRRLALLSVSPGQAGYEQHRAEQFYRDARARTSHVAGVASVSFATNLPLWAGASRGIAIEGDERRETSAPILIVSNTIDLHYFQTMGIRFLSGRDFNAMDRQESVAVAIVNEAMARRFWPNQNAVGRRFRFTGETIFRQIAGIVQNANYTSLGEAPQPCAYLPLSQNFSGAMVVYMRTDRDPATLLSAVQRELRGIDPRVPVEDVRTASRVIDQALFGAKMAVGLLSVFGVLSLALASVGLFGVMAYSVARRQKEIGLRMALGASRGGVRLMVLREGLRIVLIGLAIGLVATALIGRALSTRIFGISALDPVSISGAVAALLITALAACYLPALRASRLDPLVALRDE